MDETERFLEERARRLGPSGIDPREESLALLLWRRFAEGGDGFGWTQDGPSPFDGPKILNLACGSGGSAVALARMNFRVTAVERSPVRAGFARDLVAAERRLNTRPTIEQGDPATAPLGGPYDGVAWWNDFGSGDETSQRALLRRVAEEWLVPGGTLAVEVFNPTWWSRYSNEPDWDEPRWQEDAGTWCQMGYDGANARWTATWWGKEDRSDLLTRTVRCYDPSELSLLIEGTGLFLAEVLADDGFGDTAFDEGHSYVAFVRREGTPRPRPPVEAPPVERPQPRSEEDAWEEIRGLLENPLPSMSRDGPPEDEPLRPCEACGKPMEWLYWSSPEWTWEALCGRAGWIQVCRDCKEWTPILGGFVMN